MSQQRNIIKGLLQGLVFLFTLVISSMLAASPIAPQLLYLEDPDLNIGLDDFRSAAIQAQLIQSNSEALDFQYTRSAFWLQFDLTGPQYNHQSTLLEIGAPKPTNEVFVYIFNKRGELIESILLDNNIEQHHEREVRTLPGGFVVRLDSNTDSRIIIRATSFRNFYLPIKIWQEDDFRETETVELLKMGSFYGIILVMVLYNLFLYSNTREKNYLYYVAYATTILMLYLSMNQHMVFFDLNDNYFMKHFGDATVALLTLTRLAFCRSFLDIQSYHPKLARIFDLAIYISLAVFVLAIVPNDFGVFQTIHRALTPIGLLLIIFSMIDGIIRDHRDAKLYLLVSLPTEIGLIIGFSTLVFGLIPHNYYTDNAIFLGMALETVLLSFALASRIRRLEQEKKSALAAANRSQELAINNLEKADQMKDQLLANVSHELRTPLFGIHGLAEMALARIERDDHAKLPQYLDLIKSSGQRLTRLVNQLLDLSTARMEQQPSQFQAVDITSLLTLVQTICEHQKPLPPGLKLDKQITAGLPFALADEDQLYQVIINLTNNALKFTHSGKVTLSAELVADLDNAGNRQIKISVTDTGRGISGSDQTKITKLFEQVEQLNDGVSNNEQYYGRGAGLGLPIAIALLDGMGSKLEIKSELGQGSCFWFLLPTTNKTEVQVPQLQSKVLEKYETERYQPPTTIDTLQPLITPLKSLDDSLNHINILVVDDDHLNLSIINEQLHQYQVALNENGETALKSVAEKTPDLILLDLMMPGLSGYEVCEQLRQQHDAMDLPIIIVTARNQIDDLTKAFAMGANDYLCKPFSSEELLSRVNNHLRLRELSKTHEENSRLEAELAQYALAEKQLRLSQYQLQQTIERSDLAMITVNEAGYITLATQAFLRFTGLTSDVLVDSPLSSLLPPDEPQHLLSVSKLEGIKQDIFNKQTNLMISGKLLSVQIDINPLALDEAFYIIKLILPDTTPPQETNRAANNDPIPALKLIADARFKLVEITAQLNHLADSGQQNDSSIMQELQQLSTSLGSFETQTNSEVSPNSFNKQLVTTMSLALNCWEMYMGKTKVDLAEESKLWAVAIDGGRLRTRTMDRYLSIEGFPKVPRWRQVARTGYFVLSKIPVNHNLSELQKNQLKLALEQLQTMANAR